MGIKELFKTKQPKYDVLLKKGKITLDEVLDIEATKFLGLSFWFFNDTIDANKWVHDHNNRLKKNEKLIAKAKENGVEGLDGVEKMTLYDLTYGDKNIIKNDFIGMRNDTSLMFATVIPNHLAAYEKITGKKIDFEEIIKRCYKDEIKEAAKEADGKHSAFTVVADSTLRKFYTMMMRRRNMLLTGESCYNKNGFITDENGNLLETDIIEDLYVDTGLEGIIENKEISLGDALKELNKGKS